MKELVISIKSSSEGMSDLRKAFQNVVKRKAKGSKYEISFDNRKSFEKFAKNIYVLSSIIKFKPGSIYELAKLSGIDASNLNKIVVFYEKMGALELKENTQNGRNVKKPTVPYDSIKIDLKAA